MSCKKTQHTKQFKLDAINYRKEHPDLTQVECTSHYLRSVRGDSFTTHFFGKIQYIGTK